MTASRKKQLAIFKQTAQRILDGELSFTEANQYLDRIDFDPAFRYPGVHMNDAGETEYYLWQKGQWVKI